MTDDHAETPLDRETLAGTLGRHDYLVSLQGSALCTCGWPESRRGIDTDLQTAHREHLADAVRSALPTPGQYVAGLADDETLVERVALHGLFRHEQVAKRESAQDRWDTTLSDDDQDEYRDLARAAIRALAAALTERTNHGC